jgi:uncharacterized membrane protein
MQNLLMAVFPGIAQMENIHPLIVHFPIALLNAFFVMELLGFVLKKGEFRVAATWMLYLGTLGALAAVSAGLWAAHTVPHTDEEHAIMIDHRNLGLIVLALAIVLSVWRIRVRGAFSFKWQVLHLALALVALAVMASGADHGGLMVYKYGVAVKAVPVKGHHHHGIFGGEEEGHHDEDHPPMKGMEGMGH